MMMNIKIQRNRSALGLLAFSLVAALTIGLVASIGGAAADSRPAADQEVIPIFESPRPLFIGEPGPGGSKFGALEPASAALIEAMPETVTTVLASVPMDPSHEPTPGENSRNPIHGAVGAVASIESPMGASEIGFAEVNGSLCLFAAGKEYQGAAVGSCPSLDQAEAGRGYVVIPGLSPEYIRVVGVAPDGVAEVGIDSSGDGTVDQKVQVVSNLYQVDLPPNPSEIVGITASGDIAFRVSIPLHSFTGHAG
jgi:hypothetical protein